MSATHPALEIEQEYVDRSYNLLDRGLADAERNMSEYQALHRSTALAIQRAMRVLQESRGTGQLIFGKIENDGETMYIGRRRVRDEDFEPVVVGWHAPAAQIFYEASPQEPRGLSLKRVFAERDRRITRLIDEIVQATAADASSDSGTGITFSDALLEELDRSRDGAMRDVVATIQAEQFAIIRHPLQGAVVVQGGPGTGKTVVGLHRAAWLAFNYPELRERGILVVAPSTSFLTYVSGVLPSLDVTDVDQVEIQALYAGEAAVTGVDDVETARVKGSAAMAGALATCLRQRIGWGNDELVLSLGADRIRLQPDEIGQMLDDILARGLSHSDGRELVRTMLSNLAAERHRKDQSAQGRPVRANEATIRRLSAFNNAVDRMWPTYTPEEFLRTLYSTQAWLVRAAPGHLTADERARLYRPMSPSVTTEPWTEADLYCLDEIGGLLTRDTVTYGHLVVDEAQDLSPMQARCLSRRCPSGSYTVLGDLAQTTGPWVRDSWNEFTEHLATPATETLSLSIGYRVPAQVLALAAEQLPLAGPGLTAPISIRAGAGAPRILSTHADDLVDGAASLAREYLADRLAVAIIVPDSWYGAWLEALMTAVDLGDGRDGVFSKPVTLLPASGCKGLEFDAVILVEPAELATVALQPPRALYVAMTRCTQALAVVHSQSLPAGFPAAEPLPLLASSDPVVSKPEPPGLGEETQLDRVSGLLALLESVDLELVEQFIRRLLPAPTRNGKQTDEG